MSRNSSRAPDDGVFYPDRDPEPVIIDVKPNYVPEEKEEPFMTTDAGHSETPEPDSKASQPKEIKIDLPFGLSMFQFIKWTGACLALPFWIVFFMSSLATLAKNFGFHPEFAWVVAFFLTAASHIPIIIILDLGINLAREAVVEEMEKARPLPTGQQVEDKNKQQRPTRSTPYGALRQ